ncbi:MAG: ABC transporter permease [Chloroflexaceae bacterium]|jgi:ribose transport system permease protein|nr:ABC transporter permease [Chloroflexaceae bacterium]
MEKVVLPGAAEAAPAQRPQLPRLGWRNLVRRQELVVVALLLLGSAFLSLQTESFLTERNLLNITRNFSWIAIATLGQCLIIIIRGIDLSAGAVMALAGLVSGLCMQAGLPVPLAILAGLVSGSAIGFANGMLVARVGLPPLLVTLATMGIARGLTLGLTEGTPVRELPPAFRSLGQAEVSLGLVSLPLSFICMVLMGLLVWLLLQRTVLGRYIYTLGNNERALLVVGVPTHRLKVLVYTLGGMLTALGGMLMTAQVGVAAPTAAIGYELDIIAAAVIGGASFFGGEGGAGGAILGAALMQVLRTGLVLLGVPVQWQAVALGAMILLVTLLDAWRRRRVGR